MSPHLKLDEFIQELIVNGLQGHDQLQYYKRQEFGNFAKLYTHVQQTIVTGSPEYQLRCLHVIKYLLDNTTQKQMNLDFLCFIIENYTKQDSNVTEAMFLAFLRILRSGIQKLKTTKALVNKLKPHFVTILKARTEILDKSQDPDVRRSCTEETLLITCTLCSNEEYCDKLFSLNPQYLQKLMEYSPEYDIYVIQILDQLSRFRSRLSEVLQVIQANVNHGYLLETAKRINDRDEQFKDVFTQFLSFLLSTQQGGSMIISAGIIPLLMDSFNSKDCKMGAKWISMLDQILFNFDCLPVFFGLNGIELLVSKIESVIQECLKFEQFDSPEILLDIYDPRTDEKYREIIGYTPLVRSLLKLVLHLMQNSGGSDGMRNLIDSSLPKTLNLIFDHSFLFGHLSSYGLAVNIMSTFIHNEPTSLSVLQEKEVPLRFLLSANRPLTATVEVISALPNAFGAICLNPAGLQLYLENDPLCNYLDVFLQEKWHQSLVHNDVPHLAGSSIDELFRHQPIIKEKGYVHIENWCSQASKNIKNINIGIAEGSELLKLHPFDSELKREDSKVCLMMEIVVRFLEGLFQNVAHARELAKSEFLKTLMELFTLPTLPYDFVLSPATLSFGYVIRALLEAAHAETIGILKSTFTNVLERLKSLFSLNGDLLDCLELTSTPVANFTGRDTLLKNLVFFKAYVKLFNDLFCTHWLSSARSITGITALFDGNDLLSQIVLLGQDIEKFIFNLRKSLPLKWVLEFDIPLTAADRQAMEQGGIRAEVLADPNMLKVAKWNLNWCGPPILELPQDILSTITNLEKVICSRKVTDQTMRMSLQGITQQFSNFLKLLLGTDDVFKLRYTFQVIGALLVESRHGSKSIQTLILYNFWESGGFQMLSQKIQTILETLLETSIVPDNSIAVKFFEDILGVYQGIIDDKRFHDSVYTAALVGRQRDKSQPDYFDSYKFLVIIRTVVLKDVLKIFNHQSYTKLSDSVCSRVLKCIVTVYLAAGEVPRESPSSLPIHGSSTTAPVGLGQALQAGIFSFGTQRRPVIADPNKVSILVDMGFPEAAARTALIHCSNSVSRAADYLLNHPGIIATAQEAAEHDGQPSAPIQNDSEDVGDEEEDESEASDDQDAESAEEDYDEDMEDEFPNQSENVDLPTEVSQVNHGENLILDLRNRALSELNLLREGSKEPLVSRCLQILKNLDERVILSIKELLALIVKETILRDVIEPLIAKIDVSTDDMVSSITLFSMLLTDPTLKAKVLEAHLLAEEWFFDLLKKAETVEKWVSPLLLIFESTLVETTYVEEVLNATEKHYNSTKANSVDLTHHQLLVMELIRFLKYTEIDVDSLTAILRILVRITENNTIAAKFLEDGGIPLLFQQHIIARFPFQHAMVMMIIRHICESPPTLRLLMEAEINYFLTYPRARSVDTTNFIKGTAHILLRDPQIFKEAIRSTAEISNYEPKLAANLLNLKYKPSTPDSSLPDGPVEDTASAKLVEYLAGEIFQTKASVTPNTVQEKTILHLKRTAQLQCLAELVVVFPRCKIDLIAFTNRKSNKSGQFKTAQKNAFLNFLLAEILPRRGQGANASESVDIKYSVKESSWTMGLLTSICTIRDNYVTKFLPELELVQSCVLDSIHRNFKEVLSLEPLQISRLEVYGELCCRILTVQQQANPREKLNSDKNGYLKLSKLMIDKGFPELLTTAVGKVDVITVESKSVIRSLLKPINMLTKAAINLGREVLSTKGERKSVANFENAFHEVQDDVFMEERPEITDLYRNSALGILEPVSDESSSESDSQMEYDSMDEDDADENSTDESQTDDDMEIVIPQPFHGSGDIDMDTESESSEIGDDNEQQDDENESENNSFDWENVESDNSQIENERGLEGIDEFQNLHGDFDGDQSIHSEDEESDASAMFNTILAPHSFETQPLDESNLSPEVMRNFRNALTATGRRLDYDIVDLEEFPMLGTILTRSSTANDFLHPLLREPVVSNNSSSNTSAPRHPFTLNLSDNLEPLSRTTGNSIFERVFGRVQARSDFQVTSFPDLRTTVIIQPAASTAEMIEQESIPEQNAEQIKNLHLYRLGYSDERWKQESRMFYGSSTVDIATKHLNSLLNALLPDARTRYEEKTKKELEKESEEAEKCRESNTPVDAVASFAPSVPTDRQVITVDGNEVDITGSGIDMTFLEALPDDLRQEVINEHLQNQPSRTQRDIHDSIIHPDFLAALPDEMREHVLEELQRDSREILLPRNRQLLQISGQNADTSNLISDKPKSIDHKESIYVINFAGLVDLLKLVFSADPIEPELLDKIFSNIAENSKSRSELFGLLIAILTGDGNHVGLVDKTFSSLTLKSILSIGVADEKKLTAPLIAERCLGTMFGIVTALPTVAKYFLTELEPLYGKTPRSTKKGKTKQPTLTYPVVILLNLLDNTEVLQNSIILEPLILLLSRILRPLSYIAKKKFAKVQTASFEGEHGESSQIIQTPMKNRPLSAESISGTPSTKERPEIRLPHIPHSSVRLIIRILKDSICSSKTFQSTLSIILYLSSYPEYLKIITGSLLETAQIFAMVILKQLEKLMEGINSLHDAENLDTEILNSFTSLGAPQIKLLRVLKTIDFLFSKKHGIQLNSVYLSQLPLDKTLIDSLTPGGSESNSEDTFLDVKVLKQLYATVNFSDLWLKLSNCMAAIGENNNLIHVATVILPLIESYMVVSRPGTILAKSSISKPLSKLPFVLIRSQPEISTAEKGTFLYFAEANRKVLNTMVRNNPSLMNGSFSLLVHSPKVLEFDNKRTYFKTQLHKDSNRASHPQINLSVRRKYVFEESYQQLQGRTGDTIKYGKLAVKFRDEEGVDAGGLTREWFSTLAMQMFNPNYALFLPTAADKVTYQPNRASGINPDHLFYFKFVGRIIGKAIYDGKLLDAYFTRSFYKCMIHAPVDHRDMEAIDPAFFNSLDWILNNSIDDVLDLTYSMEVEEFGIQKIIDLKPDGRNIPVTDADKTEYVRLVVEQKLVVAIKDQIEAFLSGFNEIIPANLISIFNEQELELLISGLPDIDIDDWKNNTEYQNYSPSSPPIQWFWRAVRSFSQEERAKLIQFTTGTSKVPLGGFAKLQGSSGIQKFQIHKEFTSSSRLPSAHTCFNQLDLPQYDSYEQLRASLLLAISECGTGFGFA